MQANQSQWFLGQVLTATVTSQKSADTVILKAQNQQIEVRTNPDKPLNVGDQLKLVVAKENNSVILRVLQQETPKMVHETKQQLLRESIPKQAGMEKLTTLLNQVSSNVKEALKLLPAPIEQQFKKLIEHLPAKTSLNNEVGLKTAIKDSGIFLEAKLLAETIIKKSPEQLLKPAGQSAKQTSGKITGQSTGLITPHTSTLDIAKDLKTNLLQLSDVINKYKQQVENQNSSFPKQGQLKPMLETTKNAAAKTKNSTKAMNMALKLDAEIINKQIESSIARIEVNQSKAIVTHDNQAPLWSVELPVKDKQDIDLLKLNIKADRDSKSNNEKEQLWTANIKIDFENLGAVSARLSLIDKEVNATLWSENETLNKLINDNLFLLDKQIERCGLSTGNITCIEETETPVENKKAFKEHTFGSNLINIAI
ncbi:MAG TPA: flagellar hook-length control protein FliK [Thiotrichaceae bacterium]|jgi:hypothetical protein|nr:flagellar hook-length control protein FliK [Thiotrichaceae bacterium]HIM08735.1 flagellar hook-length control protein FliK [Gammaproteobacteria bacterium]